MKNGIRIGIVFFMAIIFSQVSVSQILFSDDFNRSDGDVGGSWSILSGTWVIEDIQHLWPGCTTFA